ncbi:MAG: terminase family protein [Sulfitobacter sp.]|uniref:terminase large subunit domain-containing protein n=1 Tax=Alphaproteobacteria TaxID=28211 RepID=UPI002AC8CAEA|nr:terminase family protein [Sulfitobacter sp. OXR-159]WPZ30749.1 terminase family protein [Sulfitobacter sp. OXR-159]WPZ30850.1 terminase family protein [Sulfitobacter sp. OXR-159]
MSLHVDPTVLDDPDTEVVWKPTPKQAEFLASDDFEVLYGGAAGGGKSDALLIDALCLQHGGLENGNHRAVLFRRSFVELRDLIGRSLELYRDIDPDATYNQTDKVWTFSSGAKVEFGYLANDNDRLKYRGRAWNYIGFDELTLWTTDVCYLYLFSRCRSTDKTLPRYIRATTNPDGPGQKWVMERWGIQETGEETFVPVDIVDEELGTITSMYRRFIPARLSENTYLSSTGYREALLQLAPEERDALLQGFWRQGKVHGAYYTNEMQRLRSEGRIRHVPYVSSAPVNTFWDLGWNDTTAIWFHQIVAGEHRFIKCYENSGEKLEHYAQYLLSAGVNLSGVHYLPHDAENKSLQTGKSAVQILRELLPALSFQVVPRTPQVLTGINQTRLAMGSNVYIDDVECVDGVAALDNYRKTYNPRLDAFTDQPMHDRFSNYADAFRQWGQVFEEIVRGHAHKPTSKQRRRATGLTA